MLPLASSANGRVSGKSWKSATIRSKTSAAHAAKWHARMEKAKSEQAVKKLEAELKHEKQTENQRRRERALQRQRAREERLRLQQEKAIMGASKSARRRRRAGRTKKISG